MDDRTWTLYEERDRNAVLRFVASLEVGLKIPWCITIGLEKITRTIKQNRRYHAVCAEIAEQLIVDGQKFSPDSLKEYFKRFFIGTSEVPMPDGTVVIFGISTTTLDKGEFADYMTKIDVWATERGIIFAETRSILDMYQQEAKRWRETERV
jgi:hypothetical protein